MGMTYEDCKKVIRNMEERLNYHKMIAKYTKQTVKLNKQQDYIKYWESAIQQAKKDYSSVYDNI
ncbi:hypothetical protein COE25_23275 [Bacillus sp. AFS031507]|nr:hypothetical protein COE25_28200 [Bacillus sp. AFS031507]PGY07784.1 hypothetical protein COE25_23275 [Bacillus sp. AFS031507]